MTSKHLIKLPGFIDVHVHAREPGGTHKEDFDSCTSAALAGGITMVCCMPNTSPAIIDETTFNMAKESAKAKARCDYALYVGASHQNSKTVYQLAPRALGLKMYLNETFTTLTINNISIWSEHLGAWPKNTPLCVHAERHTLAAVLLIASFHNKHIHVCHVARKEDILIIKAAKERGMKVTCEVCPHHLFLTANDIQRIGVTQSRVKPMLATPADQEALWDNLHLIDCFATDHAPHSVEEKASENAPAGYPGLETVLPLLLNAVHNGKLSMEDLVQKFYHNPRRIFQLPEQPDTYIEVDVAEEWTIPKAMKYTKLTWTPFAGMKVKGSVHKVVLRGEVAYEQGKVMVPPGFGQDVREWENKNLLDIFPSFPETRLPHHTMVNRITGKHILSATIFTQNHIDYIFNLSQDFRVTLYRDRHLDHVLRGKIMACVFYSFSTRGRSSLISAMQRLGGGVVSLEERISSSKKGESLQDTIMTLSGYVDIIGVRHPTMASVKKISKACKKPIINLGDGTGEHPTQALLDLFTIREELGTINGLIIAIVGDLKNERTAHSLAKILAMYDVKLRYVSPETMKMPQDVTDYVATHPNVQQQEFDSLEEILPDTDVVYMTRMHKERAVNPEEEKAYMQLVITPQLMTKAKKRMIVLHPLPRSFEIAREFDTDARAAYFRQAEYGLYVRMALLAMVLGRV